MVNLPAEDLMASPNSVPPPSFEKISHLGELLIVIFYAEAYQQAATNFIEAYKQSGLSLGPVLLFVIFFTVTVRFFVGNHLHLADERWNEKLPESKNEETRWTTEQCRRDLYYFDALFIVLESLAMIVLGGVGSVEASVKLLAGVLIFISGVDVVWICFQWLLDLFLRRWPCKTPPALASGRYRPSTKLHKWLFLNIGVIIALGFPLLCSWNERLSAKTLCEITAINVAAFLIDIFVCNLFAA
jgi:hypothetical protein